MRENLTNKQNFLMENRVLLVIWLAVALGFVVLRSSTLLIWDDSPRLSHFLFEPSTQIIDGEPRTLIKSLTEAFSATSAAGYRPLSIVIGILGLEWFSQDNYPSFFWFLGVGAIIATLAVCVIFVARHYLITTGAAYFALFLFLFSTPVITGGWVVFVGIQAIVPLFICLGLILYWKILEKSRLKNCYFIALCLVLFFGPWFREFIGLLPLLLIIQEFQRRQYFSRVSTVSCFAFLHALYPTAVVKLLIPDLPLKPVFGMGFLGGQLRGDEISFIQEISLLKWHISWHFLSLFPPILLSLILLSFIISIKPLNLIKTRKRRFFFSFLLFLVAFLLVVYRIYLISIFQDPIKGFFLLPIVVLIVSATLYRAQVAVLPPKRHKEYKKSDIIFLLIWFSLSFIPFLKVYTSQVHLAYVVLPVSILVAGSVEHLWQYVFATRRQLPRLFYLTSFLIVIVISDHALNLYGSYKVVNGMNEGILTVSDWIKRNLPRDSIIVSNFLHLEDIRLYSDNSFTPFWTVPSGVAGERVVETPEKLEKLLKENHGKRSIYFLATEFDYTPVKSRYHPHKYVRGRNVEMENLGIIHTTQVKYPYLDPFKSLTPRSYVSFLGSPDLVDDFYRGSAQNGQLMMREIYAEYHLFKVTGLTVDPWNPFATIYLIQAGYKGFNVLEIDGKFFAIPQGEGSPYFDQSLKEEDFSRFFMADELEEIYSQIDQVTNRSNRRQNLSSN